MNLNTKPITIAFVQGNQPNDKWLINEPGELTALNELIKIVSERRQQVLWNTKLDENIGISYSLYNGNHYRFVYEDYWEPYATQGYHPPIRIYRIRTDIPSPKNRLVFIPRFDDTYFDDSFFH